MKMKKLVALGVAAVLAFAAIGCGNSGEEAPADESNTQEDEGAADDTAAAGEILGNNVTYDTAAEVNNGEEIELEWWIWDGADMMQKFVDEYQAIHPNVSIKIVDNPWDDYWTKLPLSLNGGQGPALFNVHNSYHDNIIDNMAPYDIELDDLKADFVGVEGHVIDGEIYYIDYGMMTGVFIYNVDMWEEAGLTDEDIPTTWDELAEVAQILTIKDGDNFQQAGLNLNGNYHSMLLGQKYQLGENLVAEDGTPLIDTDAMNETAQRLLDFYDVYDTGSKDFGTDSGDSFGQGLAAMTYAWGFMYGHISTNYPDINFDAFEVPTIDGSEPYAYERYNGESTLGINADLSDEEMAVAQDFVRFYLVQADIQKEMCISYGVYPTNRALEGDADILANPMLSAFADHIERYIWPGPLLSTFEDTLKKAMEDVMYNGVNLDNALSEAQDTIERDLEQTNFESVEGLYKFADEAN